MHAVPRFLWNAKMRFGKTFTAYQLAKKLGAKRVLVVTFKPAVEDAWQTDLESHVDFDGWQYLSRNSGSDPTQIDAKKPVVYFGSFQDLLGRDAAGNIKPKNEWLHKVNWDLVVFDEYHFGAWRETAKELFEGEEEAVAKKEAKLEYAAGLDEVNEDLGELSEKETEFLPITTRAYLYLSGTPFKALATGEFIEEQIFNWTYTDEQRAKEEFAAKQPGQVEPLRRAAADAPADLPDAGRAAGDRQRRGVRRVRPQRVLRGHRARARTAQFKHKSDVQKWLDIIRGAYAPKAVEQPQDRHAAAVSRIRTCACCPTCSTRSGSCPTSRPATRWRTCWPRSTTPSGTTTRSSSPPARRRASGWTRCRPCARPSAAGSTPRPSRSPAASSPPASPCRSGRRS